MKRLFNIHIVFFAIFILLSTHWTKSFATEGFDCRSMLLSPKVANAWKSTFMVLIDSPKVLRIGSAFLVKKRYVGKEIVLDFLTNNHVIKNDCSDGYCPNILLVEDPKLEYDSDGKMKIRSLEGLVFRDVEIITQSDNPDLALLRIRFFSEDQKNIPRALEIGKTCNLAEKELLYTIGFSDTHDRVDPNRVPITNQNWVVKRWSQGFFTGYIKSNNNDNVNTHFWSGTSVDVLRGGSGGPLLNREGEVVGVLKGGASGSENQYRYLGNENKGRLDWQSIAVRCEYLDNFINQKN